ncbi:MAG: hypothetical protein J5U19_13960 [Candidatus Methanoperedens sp.]|nr:hypothetical protein [Candidatus Methanoperedens sp.]
MKEAQAKLKEAEAKLAESDAKLKKVYWFFFWKRNKMNISFSGTHLFCTAFIVFLSTIFSIIVQK